MSKIQITICNTCIRDNYGEGVFCDTPSVERVYREKLQGLSPDQTPEVKLQNCFNYCEMFHCVQVDDQKNGYLLKQISDPEKIRAVCEWVKNSASIGQLELPESLKDHLIETPKIAS